MQNIGKTKARSSGGGRTAVFKSLRAWRSLDMRLRIVRSLSMTGTCALSPPYSSLVNLYSIGYSDIFLSSLSLRLEQDTPYAVRGPARDLNVAERVKAAHDGGRTVARVELLEHWTVVVHLDQLDGLREHAGRGGSHRLQSRTRSAKLVKVQSLGRFQRFGTRESSTH